MILGWAGAVRGMVKRTTIANPAAKRIGDLLGRQFGALAPDRLWVADFERHEAFANPAVVEGHCGILSQQAFEAGGRPATLA